MNGGKTMKMKKETLYILTGGAGFLGSLICRELLERGEKGKTCTVEEIKVLMDAYIKGAEQ